VLDYHVLELEECLRSWENSTNLCARPARNLGAAWGSTCLDGPCDKGTNVVLETTVLHRERPEVKLVQFGIL
jgi:hypothetical protein